MRYIGILIGLVVIALVAWFLGRRQPAGAAPVITFPDGETHSLVLPPKQEQKITETAFEVIAAPVPSHQEAIEPVMAVGVRSIKVKGTMWRPDTKQWAAKVYIASSFGPTVNNWRDPTPYPLPEVEGRDGSLMKIWYGLEETIEFHIPDNVLKTQIRLFATIGDMTAPIAQSGTFVVEDGMVIIYNDSAGAFSI